MMKTPMAGTNPQQCVGAAGLRIDDASDRGLSEA
jgi:hypothetical protein